MNCAVKKQIEIKSGAKTSVWLFLLGVSWRGLSMQSSTAQAWVWLKKTADEHPPTQSLIIMLSVATLTTVICKVDTDNILNSSTFKAGMKRLLICILGVAWLGRYFRFQQHRLDQRYRW